MKSVNRAKLDLIIAVTAFGTIGIFVRYINLPSSVIAFVRGAVGAVFLLLLLYLRRTPFRWASVQPHWKLLALSGAIISFNWITLFEAYRYTTVATATLCYYMAPVFVTLASPFLFHEKLTPRKLLCVLAALCGMVFVSGVPQSGLPEAGEATGILLALLSAVLYASDVSINKFLDQVPACERTLVQLAVAAGLRCGGDDPLHPADGGCSRYGSDTSGCRTAADRRCFPHRLVLFPVLRLHDLSPRPDGGAVQLHRPHRSHLPLRSAAEGASGLERHPWRRSGAGLHPHQ